jgi:fatty-acyl-CoA synthase
MSSLLRRQTLGDLLRRSAARWPEKLAVACGETRWTYRQFNEIADRLAAGLAEQGVVKGERVAILARNSHGFAAMRFALARLGVVLVPINFMLKPDEVAYI